MLSIVNKTVRFFLNDKNRFSSDAEISYLTSRCLINSHHNLISKIKLS